MISWVRRVCRADMDSRSAHLDAENEIDELYAAIDDLKKSNSHARYLDLLDELEDAKQESRTFDEENQKLRSPEAAAAIFLESPAGKAILEKLKTLDDENKKLRGDS